jgi:hypothetical protein
VAGVDELEYGDKEVRSLTLILNEANNTNY